jgi:hypothetical protein
MLEPVQFFKLSVSSSPGSAGEASPEAGAYYYYYYHHEHDNKQRYRGGRISKKKLETNSLPAPPPPLFRSFLASTSCINTKKVDLCIQLFGTSFFIYISACAYDGSSFSLYSFLGSNKNRLSLSLSLSLSLIMPCTLFSKSFIVRQIIDICFWHDDNIVIVVMITMVFCATTTRFLRMLMLIQYFPGDGIPFRP